MSNDRLFQAVSQNFSIFHAGQGGVILVFGAVIKNEIEASAS